MIIDIILTRGVYEEKNTESANYMRYTFDFDAKTGSIIINLQTGSDKEYKSDSNAASHNQEEIRKNMCAKLLNELKSFLPGIISSNDLCAIDTKYEKLIISSEIFRHIVEYEKRNPSSNLTFRMIKYIYILYYSDKLSAKLLEYIFNNEHKNYLFYYIFESIDLLKVAFRNSKVNPLPHLINAPMLYQLFIAFEYRIRKNMNKIHKDFASDTNYQNSNGISFTLSHDDYNILFKWVYDCISKLANRFYVQDASSKILSSEIGYDSDVSDESEERKETEESENTEMSEQTERSEETEESEETERSEETEESEKSSEDDNQLGPQRKQSIENSTESIVIPVDIQDNDLTFYDNKVYKVTAKTLVEASSQKSINPHEIITDISLNSIFNKKHSVDLGIDKLYISDSVHNTSEQSEYRHKSKNILNQLQDRVYERIKFASSSRITSRWQKGVYITEIKNIIKQTDDIEILSDIYYFISSELNKKFLNVHENYLFDTLFFKKNTNSWQDLIEFIRKHAFKVLLNNLGIDDIVIDNFINQRNTAIDDINPVVITNPQKVIHTKKLIWKINYFASIVAIIFSATIFMQQLL